VPPTGTTKFCSFIFFVKIKHVAEFFDAIRALLLCFFAFCSYLLFKFSLFCRTPNRGLAHAHSAENLTELDPTTKLAGKYSLLGCDITQAKHRALADCVSISALRATEILEYTLLKKLHSLQSDNNAQNASGGDGIASIGKSLTDMFSWKASSGGNNAAVPPKSPRRGTSAGTAGASATGGNAAAGSTTAGA